MEGGEVATCGKPLTGVNDFDIPEIQVFPNPIIQGENATINTPEAWQNWTLLDVIGKQL